MFCSHCGQALLNGQPFCAQCGQPVQPMTPPIPGFEFELDTYAAKIKALSIFWLVYAGLAILVGLASLSFARLFLMGGPFGPWLHTNPPPDWLLPALLRFAWITIVVRSVLAAVAAWGLWERSGWGRIVAIVAAFASILKFPFGAALGIWTLVVLLGYRNRSLYHQLPRV